MEILLAIAVASVVTSHGLKNAIVDVAFALRGQPSPRWHRAKVHKPQERGAFASYLAELWRDSWTDAQARHVRRRVRRLANEARPPGAFRAYATGVARDGWRRWDAAWQRAEERRLARPRPHRPGADRIVVPAAQGEVTSVTDVDEYRNALRDVDEFPGPDETPEYLAANSRVHEAEAKVPWIKRWPVATNNNPTPGPGHPAELTTTGRNAMSTNAPIGEVTGLTTAITNCGTAAKQAEDWIPAIEQLTAGITAGGVGGGTTGHLATAQEHFTAAAAALREAEQDLIRQLGVKEQYDANPDAGEKAFVTAE